METLSIVEANFYSCTLIFFSLSLTTYSSLDYGWPFSSSLGLSEVISSSTAGSKKPKGFSSYFKKPSICSISCESL